VEYALTERQTPLLNQILLAIQIGGDHPDKTGGVAWKDGGENELNQGIQRSAARMSSRELKKQKRGREKRESLRTLLLAGD